MLSAAFFFHAQCHHFQLVQCDFPRTTEADAAVQLCRHVIIETNKTTARLFPEVPDCETDAFWDHMEKLIVLNKKLMAISNSDAPKWLKNLQKVPVIERFAAELLALFLGKTIQSGSVDFSSNEAAIVY